MEFSCTQAELNKAITTASRAISKAQQSITDAILFEAGRDVVTLKATDRTISIKTRIAANVVSEGRMAIPAKLLSDFVKHLPDGNVTVQKVDETKARIQCLNAQGNLRLMNHEEFPEFPDVKLDTPMQIASDQLAQMVERTIFSTASGEDRPILTGELFHMKKDTLRIVAIDGFRMAIREEPVVSDIEGEFIIPARALRELIRSVPADGSDVSIYFDHGRVLFMTKDTQIIAQLIEGTYMPYETYLKKTFSTHISINRDAFRDSIERAEIFSDHTQDHIVTLTLKENVLDICANSQVGSANEPIAVAARGDDISIALNPKYLLDVLKAIDDDEISITMSSPIEPCVIERKGIESYFYLILPIQTRATSAY